DPVPPSERVGGVPAELDKLCMALLDRAPDRRPRGEEILHVLGAARASRDFPSLALLTQTADRSALVGRQSHLRALRQAFEACLGGRPVTVCVRGRAGMGKSAIVQHFVNELAERGEAVVLRGRAYEREAVPYKAVDSVIDALSHYLLRLSERAT